MSDYSDLEYLFEVKRGIERECLRVTPEGRLSQSPHSKNLGSALTHPFIVTDFAECLLELITPPLDSVDELYEHLKSTHAFVAKNLENNEVLWPTSMPCLIESEENIPIAYYGESNIGKMKTIYREGLKNRYGSLMQTISGIHYNFSFSDNFWKELKEKENSSENLKEYKSRKYMELIRNFHRYGWIIPYFFGASPALCKSFLKSQNIDPNEKKLKPLDEKGTFYTESGTSLRMSDLGYQNKKSQKNLEVCYNSLENYVKCLERAIYTKDENWAKIGIKKDGKYLQLSDSILQIENEYYGIIRPKRASDSPLRPSLILKNEGVEYIEVRIIDVNPFSELGITKDQIHFLDAFLSYCLLGPAIEFSSDQIKTNKENLEKIVSRGRDENLILKNERGDIPKIQWIDEILSELKKIAPYFGKNCLEAIERIEKEDVLSQKVERSLRDSQKTFFRYSLDLGIEVTNKLKAIDLDHKTIEEYKKLSTKSLSDQEKIEKEDQLELSEFIAKYFE